MVTIVGVISQKGGVGKSTVCRLIAKEYAVAGWQVKIADLDVGQGTSYDWQSRRLKSGVDPEIPVERFGSVGQALKYASAYDLIVFDGKPYANVQTLEIARAAHLLILPTGLSLDDMKPSVLLANELCQKGIAKEKFGFAFCRVGDSAAELGESHAYLLNTGYSVFAGALPEKTGYRRASDTGLTPTETRFSSLNKKADELAQSIINKITQLAEET